MNGVIEFYSENLRELRDTVRRLEIEVEKVTQEKRVYEQENEFLRLQIADLIGQ